jgi:hypothetical protein
MEKKQMVTNVMCTLYSAKQCEILPHNNKAFQWKLLLYVTCFSTKDSHHIREREYT